MNLFEKKELLDYLKEHVSNITKLDAKSFINSLDDTLSSDMVKIICRVKGEDKYFCDLADFTNFLIDLQFVKKQKMIFVNQKIIIPSVGTLAYNPFNMGNGFFIYNRMGVVLSKRHNKTNIYGDIDYLDSLAINVDNKLNMMYLVIFSHIYESLFTGTSRKEDIDELFTYKDNVRLCLFKENFNTINKFMTEFISKEYSQQQTIMEKAVNSLSSIKFEKIDEKFKINENLDKDLVIKEQVSIKCLSKQLNRKFVVSVNDYGKLKQLCVTDHDSKERVSFNLPTSLAEMCLKDPSEIKNNKLVYRILVVMLLKLGVGEELKFIKFI